MRKICMLLMFVLACSISHSQPAKQVLDKASAAISSKGGVSASFTMTSGQYGNVSGNISIKGRKFYTTTPMATVWFDGKTQWTYLKRSEEVNINNPTEAELQAINPYNFINMYRSGFSYSMKSVGKSHQVHLKAISRTRQIQEMYITVDKKTYIPSVIKMRQGAGWSTITIKNFKKSNLSDNLFKFNSGKYPNAEIIDLR